MHTDFQRAEWLNNIIAQMWPFISDFIKRILRETVEPSVKAPIAKYHMHEYEFSSSFSVFGDFCFLWG